MRVTAVVGSNKAEMSSDPPPARESVIHRAVRFDSDVEEATTGLLQLARRTDTPESGIGSCSEEENCYRPDGCQQQHHHHHNQQPPASVQTGSSSSSTNSTSSQESSGNPTIAATSTSPTSAFRRLTTKRKQEPFTARSASTNLATATNGIRRQASSRPLCPQ